MSYDAVLNFLTQQEYIGLLDRHFANFIARLTKGSPLQTTFVLAGALASRAAGRDSEYGMCVPVSALNSMTDLAEYLHIPPEEIPPVMPAMDSGAVTVKVRFPRPSASQAMANSWSSSP